MKIGDTLAGRYEVRATLGAGGLGEVFVARDTRSRRDVAVKVFDPARCPAPRLAAMAALLAAASRVDHPALVLPKIQIGLSERPPFVVSEWIAGEDLAALLARAKCVPWQRALALGLTCAEGLAAAFKATGRPHCALKPGNIRVTPNGEARVLDYGIGELGAAEPPRPRSDGNFAEYRAPEQIQGAPLDARTDVFALGVLLFELMTGVHPFMGSTAHKAMWKVSMPTLSVQPSELAPATPLPSQVEKLLVRALARAPADRFKDLTDMAHHLALAFRSPGAPTRAPGPATPASATTDGRMEALPAGLSSEDMTTALSLPVVRQPRPVEPPQRAAAEAAPSQAQPERPGSADPPSPPLLPPFPAQDAPDKPSGDPSPPLRLAPQASLSPPALRAPDTPPQRTAAKTALPVVEPDLLPPKVPVSDVFNVRTEVSTEPRQTAQPKASMPAQETVVRTEVFSRPNVQRQLVVPGSKDEARSALPAVPEDRTVQIPKSRAAPGPDVTVELPKKAQRRKEALQAAQQENTVRNPPTEPLSLLDPRSPPLLSMPLPGSAPSAPPEKPPIAHAAAPQPKLAPTGPAGSPAPGHEPSSPSEQTFKKGLVTINLVLGLLIVLGLIVLALLKSR